MKTSLLAVTGVVTLFGSLAQAQNFELRQPLTSNARQIQPHVSFPSAPVGGSDNCATPDAIVGAGPHAFDNTLATTGTEGQSTVNCIFSGQIACADDVWFSWTAPSTGTFEISTCGQTTVDTKIIVNSGTACPAAGGTAAGCNDDLQTGIFPGNFQSRATFTATAGSQFLIQLGLFPVAPLTPGTGTFRIDPVINQDPYVRDDGTTENSTRLVAPVATTCWMVAQGDVTTGVRNVIAVRTAFGATPAGSNGVTNGNPTQIGVWEDPNDDGNPSDAVLLSTFTGVVANEGTDTLNVYTLPTPVTVTNGFFVGAAYNHGVSLGFPAPIDVDGCGARPLQNWAFGNAATTVDMTTLSANSTPPVQFGETYGFLLRSDTVPATTGTLFCFGDGSGTACPCGNASVVGANEGCVNSLTTAGKLRAIGVSSIGGDTLTLQGSQVPNGPGLYFQGPLQLGSTPGFGNVFGDGLRCVGGSPVIRLGIITAASNASTYPSGVTPPNNIPVSTKGFCAAGDVRNYQLWYRDSAIGFCSAAVFNLTNGIQITWAP